jgi:hypothetical protein
MEEADHLMVVRKQKRKRGKGWDPDIPFEEMAPIT